MLNIKLLKLFLLLIICSFEAFGQPSRFMMSMNDTIGDVGLCIEKTFDNGYIAGGFGAGAGGGSKVFKIDSSGQFVWSTFFKGGIFLAIYDMTRTKDLNFCLTGVLSRNNYGADLVYIKLNSNGDTIATKSININGNTGTTWGMNISQTADSGVVLSGEYRDSTTNYYYLVVGKIDKYNNIEWLKTIRVFGHAYGPIKQTNDGGFVAGTSGNGIVLLKFDSSGNILWNHNYSTSSSMSISFHDFLENQQGYLIYGSVDCIPLLIQTDSLGNIVWQKSYQNVCTYPLPKLIKTFDKCFMLSTNETDGGHLIKIDSTGNLLWESHLPTAIYDVVEAKDSGVAVVGGSPPIPFVNPLLQIIKTDSLGSGLQCSYPDTGIYITQDTLYEDSLILTVNSTWSYKHWIIIPTHHIITFDTTCLILGAFENEMPEDFIQIFPNPCHGSLSINLKIDIGKYALELYSSNGQLIYKNIYSDKVWLDLNNFSKGLYLLKLFNQRINLTKKIVLE